MKTVHHPFKTPAEAQAFLDGVEYANDAALSGRIDPKDPCTVVTFNEDGHEDNPDGQTFHLHATK